MSITKIILISTASVLTTAIVGVTGYFVGKDKGKREVLDGPLANAMRSALGDEVVPRMPARQPVQASA